MSNVSTRLTRIIPARLRSGRALLAALVFAGGLPLPGAPAVTATLAADAISRGNGILTWKTSVDRRHLDRTA